MLQSRKSILEQIKVTLWQQNVAKKSWKRLDYAIYSWKKKFKTLERLIKRKEIFLLIF